MRSRSTRPGRQRRYRPRQSKRDRFAEQLRTILVGPALEFDALMEAERWRAPKPPHHPDLQVEISFNYAAVLREMAVDAVRDWAHWLGGSGALYVTGDVDPTDWSDAGTGMVRLTEYRPATISGSQHGD